MKPYGNTPRDNVCCQYGCCHSDLVRGRGRHGRRDAFSPCPRVRRASKRRARALNKEFCSEHE